LKCRLSHSNSSTLTVAASSVSIVLLPPALLFFFSDVLTDLDTFLSLSMTTPLECLITGDFNLHLDNHTNSQALQFLSALDSTSLTIHVSFPTHRENHTLDLVVTDNLFSLPYDRPLACLFFCLFPYFLYFNYITSLSSSIV